MSAGNNYHPSALLLQNETTSTDLTYDRTVPQKGGYPAVGACPPYVQSETKGTGFTHDTIRPTHDGRYWEDWGTYEHGTVNPMYSQREYYIDATNTLVVNQPGRTVNDVNYTKAPTDYTIPSILVCLFCFWPTALVARYYASRAKSLAARGDFVEATTMSDNARNMVIVSFVIGIFGNAMILYYYLTQYK